ncbi:MAG: ferritin-like domain-containing protein [Vicinamibacterales bacterium]
MSAENLREALVEEIRDLYNAEKQLVKALPKMAKGAESDELRDAFEQHLEETEGHVTRLEQVFDLLGEKPRGKHCAGMAGIVEEGSEKLQEDMEGSVLDACLIASAQKVEHYEIGAYGTAIAWAEALGLNDVCDVLNETLEEEKAADEKLSALAESGINQAATAGEAEDSDMEEEDEEEEAGARAGSRGQREQPQASASARQASGAKPARARGGRR